MQFRTDAHTLIALTVAAILAPPQQVAPSAWAAQNLVVPDGPRAGEAWDPLLTPYMSSPSTSLGPIPASTRSRP